MSCSPTHTDQTPTAVLVHSSVADASSWAGVISELQSDSDAGAAISGAA
jgi:hypothetical protein